MPGSRNPARATVASGDPDAAQVRGPPHGAAVAAVVDVLVVLVVVLAVVGGAVVVTGGAVVGVVAGPGRAGFGLSVVDGAVLAVVDDVVDVGEPSSSSSATRRNAPKPSNARIAATRAAISARRRLRPARSGGSAPISSSIGGGAPTTMGPAGYSAVSSPPTIGMGS